MKMKKNKNHRKGFTLIEGIMVVAIIGILSLILIPNVLGVIKKNKINSYNNLIESVKTAAKTYTSDNRYTLKNIDCSNDRELSAMCIKVQDLIDAGDLSSKFVNPVNNQVIDTNNENEQVLVTYYCRTKNFDYKYRAPITDTTEEALASSEFDSNNCTSNINFKIDSTDATYNKKNAGSEWYVSDVKVEIVAEGAAKDKYTYCIKKGDEKCTYSTTTAPNNIVLLENDGANYKVCAYTDLTDEVCTAPIKIDKSVPVAPKMIASDKIASDIWHKANYSISLEGSSSLSEIKYYYGIDSSKITSSGSSISVSSNTPGQVYFAKACNGAKTCSTISQYNAKLDKTIPESLNITTSDNIKSGSWHKSDFNLNISSATTSAISGLTYKYGTSSSNIDTEGQTVILNTNTSGTTYYAKLCTGSGNCTAVQSYTAKLDKNIPGAPTISASDGITTGNYHSNAFTLSFSGQSSISGIDYYYGTSSSSITNVSSSVSVNTSQDNVTYYAKACTKAGICGNYNSYNVRINTTPAVPTITTSDGISSGSWHSNNFYLYFNSPTSGATIYYGTSTSSMNSTGTSLYYTTNTTGRTYYAKACNGSFCSNAVSYTIKLDNATPSAPSMSASDGIGSGGSHSGEFTMYFSAATPTSGIDHYEFRTPGYVDNYTVITGNSISSGYSAGATLNCYAIVCNGVGRCSSDGYYQIVFGGGDSSIGVYQYYYDSSCNEYYVTTCESDGTTCNYSDSDGNVGMLYLPAFSTINPCGGGGGSSSSEYSVNDYYYDGSCNEYYITTCKSDGTTCNYSIRNGSYSSGTVYQSNLLSNNPCSGSGTTTDTYTDYIGGDRCSSGVLYHITYCQPASSSAYCKYDQINGSYSSGKILRNSLSAASQCGGGSSGTTYTQKTTRGNTYIWNNPSYGGKNCIVASSGAYSPSGCSSYSNGAIKDGVTIYVIDMVSGYVHFLAPKASSNYSYTQGTLKSQTYNGTSYYEFYMTGSCSGKYCIGSTTN